MFHGTSTTRIRRTAVVGISALTLGIGAAVAAATAASVPATLSPAAASSSVLSVWGDAVTSGVAAAA